MARSNDKIIYFAAGALIGAGAALLLAPSTGQALRATLGDKAGEGREALVRRGQRLFSQGRELFEHGKQIAEDAASMFEEGREMLEREVAAGPEIFRTSRRFGDDS